MIIDNIDLSAYIECKECGSIFKYDSPYKTRKLYCNKCLAKRKKESIEKASAKKKVYRDKAKEKIKSKINKIPDFIENYYCSVNFLQKITGWNKQNSRNNLTKETNRKYKNCYIENENNYITNTNHCFYDIRDIIKTVRRKSKAKNLSKQRKDKYIDILNKLIFEFRNKTRSQNE